VWNTIFKPLIKVVMEAPKIIAVLKGWATRRRNWLQIMHYKFQCPCYWLTTILSVLMTELTFCLWAFKLNYLHNNMRLPLHTLNKRFSYWNAKMFQLVSFLTPVHSYSLIKICLDFIHTSVRKNVHQNISRCRWLPLFHYILFYDPYSL